MNPPPAPLFDTLANTLGSVLKHPEPANAYPEDYHYAHQFLYSYRGSMATFNAYRREVERLLHWSWIYKKHSITQLTRTDIEQYIEFCQHPPHHWIGLKNVPRFINLTGRRMPHPEWRPFVVTASKAMHAQGKRLTHADYALSQNALQAIFAICSSFYQYLIQENVVQHNPVAQIRQKSKFLRKRQSQKIIRRLSELQWSYVIESTEQLAANDRAHERSLFIMNALFGMYLRISELATSKNWEPQMCDFHMDGDGNWWFRTVGKGNKERIVTVSNAMLSALKRYRISLDLTPLPTLNETTPLIRNNRQNGPIRSTRHIRSIVQICFNAAIERLKKDNFLEEAEQLQAATVHWLRHTGISEDVKIRPREHVRDDAGHSSSAITDKYIDIELRERHASGKLKKIKPEE